VRARWIAETVYTLDGRKEQIMYVGLGLIIVILAVVVIFSLMRRSRSRV
jgi:hypothetical protein